VVLMCKDVATAREGIGEEDVRQLNVLKLFDVD
jgi:hypothetical protein